LDIGYYKSSGKTKKKEKMKKMTYNELIKSQVDSKLDTIRILSKYKNWLISVLSTITKEDTEQLKTVCDAYTNTIVRIKTVTRELTPLLYRGGYFKTI